MRRQKYPWTAADKARWLAELARAIDEAQQIVWRLSILRGDDPYASQIYGQLESARDEVERLQRGSRGSVSVKLDDRLCDLVSRVSACTAGID